MKKAEFKTNTNKIWFTTHDLSGKYIECSDNIKGILGNDASYYIGKNGYEFIHPDDLREIVGAHMYIKTDVVVSQYRIINSKNEYVWVKTIAVHINDKIILMRELL